MQFDVKNLNLAKDGLKRIDWAEKSMDVLRLIRNRFAKQKPLKGVRIACCLHVTTETANLMRTFKAGGAQIALCASNPLSTQDATAAAIVKHVGIPVFAICGEDRKTYYKHLNQALAIKPHITIDDGADLVSLLHTKRKDMAKQIWGSLEETTTGVIRLKSLEKAGKLLIPVIAINDAKTKHFFDNRYGTGQSTMDGIIRATNVLLAGKTLVIAGYGWCGRGAAMRARGLGAKVVVTEVDHLKAIEAAMDGYQVMTMSAVAPIGDIFITLTGDINVVRVEHMKKMKDGAIICNSGHFDVEIEIKKLRKVAKKQINVREFVEEYTLPNGKRVNIIAEGRLVNLAAAEGHPASVMDMSFANQSLSCEFVAKNHEKLEKKVYQVPESIDTCVAEMKLRAMGIKIDKLTLEQKKYLTSWEIGT